jgi:hypothetical protein
MRPEPAVFHFGYETQPGAKELENVGGLRNQQIASFQEWRGERWTFQSRIVEKLHNSRTTKIWIACDVDIIRTSFF